MVPPHKIFTGQVPDKIQDPTTGKDTPVDAPYVLILGPDSSTPGGTSKAINRIYMVQVAIYATKQADAIYWRDLAADLLEEAALFLDREKLFDVTQGAGGVDEITNGLTRAFMRFDVETLRPRPRRKG